ncbi:hypothetical protein AGMMS4956_11470 [Bacteroidia bacterium]|nr:hypothetical protein AGMMS4956_11470 [Bacteroidia bacterium]
MNITPEQALERLMNTCTRYETSTFKAGQKLQQWKIDNVEQEKILQQLVRQHFIDDARYARNFVRNKSQRSQWGAQKIRAYLQQQRLSADLIAQALQEIDVACEPEVLKKLLNKKWSQTKGKNDADVLAKLTRFGVQKGYKYSLVAEVLRALAKERNVDNE